jgi:hypothetical protein
MALYYHDRYLVALLVAGNLFPFTAIKGFSSILFSMFIRLSLQYRYLSFRCSLRLLSPWHSTPSNCGCRGLLPGTETDANVLISSRKLLTSGSLPVQDLDKGIPTLHVKEIIARFQFSPSSIVIAVDLLHILIECLNLPSIMLSVRKESSQFLDNRFIIEINQV